MEEHKDFVNQIFKSVHRGFRIHSIVSVLTKASENSPTSISGEMNRFFTIMLLNIGIICYNI